jgi:hypothetical protein
MNLSRMIFCLALSAALCGAPSLAATEQDPVQLLDHLAGTWVMRGTIGGKQTTHDVEATWVLNREYLRLHEVSREKDSSGKPLYEAIVFMSWDAKSQQYACLWLDSTGGGGLSAPGIAHGKQAGNSIPLLFTLSPTDSLHTTFTYSESPRTWQLLIDEDNNGKVDHFADVTLTKAP